jgi:hypothetical protein
LDFPIQKRYGPIQHLLSLVEGVSEKPTPLLNVAAAIQKTAWLKQLSRAFSRRFPAKGFTLSAVLARPKEEPIPFH